MKEVSDEFILEYVTDKLGFKPYAIIAYGSRVAGYATATSDYDYIIVLEGFKEKIRYLYERIDSNIYASLLLVDKSFFEEDIVEGKHGEFVAGRLYNIYRCVYNEKYVKDMETILKLRAIIEELCILRNNYGDLFPFLLIPLKYILFARLKKRMVAYPPVKYSYYKTYYGPQGERNLKSTLNGFREAAEILDREGLIKFENGYISVPTNLKTCNFKDIIKIFSRSFKMYITHGMSAKVDLKVVFDEFSSKVKRGLESIRVPLELRSPETLLELREGMIIHTRKPLDDIIKALHGKQTEILSFKRKHLFSELYYIDISSTGSNAIRMVYKKYSYLFLFKWLLIVTWLLGLKRFVISPRKRMINEYRGYLELRELGISVPKVYAILWKDNSMIIEYIDGKTLNKFSGESLVNLYYNIGFILGRIHSANGLSLGDVKPNNIIISSGSIYIVDLEQYGIDNNLKWDVGEFIYYSNVFWSMKRNFHTYIRKFLEGYREGLGDDILFKEVIRKVIGLRFIIAFLPFVRIDRIIEIRNIIKEFL